MFKHRDNIQHNATTVDPAGGGYTLSGAAPHAAMSSFGSPVAAVGGDEGGVAVAAVPATAARKRARDIRGIDKFRQVMFGERGFPRLHGMVSRTPILMYPPDGIDDARRRVARRREELERKSAEAMADEDMFGLFEERRQAEADAEAETQTDPGATLTTHGVKDTPQQRAHDEALSNYHHKQLDAFLKLFYEFNHTTFVKLPVNDALQLISRCGKEAVAHTMEYEMHARLSRDAMLKELRDLRNEEARLQVRRDELDAAEESRALREAERADEDMDAYLMDMASAQLSSAVAEKEALDRFVAPQEGEVASDVDVTALEVSSTGAEALVTSAVTSHDPAEVLETIAEGDGLVDVTTSPPRRVHFAEAELPHNASDVPETNRHDEEASAEEEAEEEEPAASQP